MKIGLSTPNNYYTTPTIPIYYTSRENTLIPLDESHVSRLLATCVSVGSVTAGATQGVAPAIK